MKMLISVALLILPAAAIYLFWLRPVLQENPTLREFYDNERSFFQALRDKVTGLKQKLATIAVVAASTLVTVHDLVLPIILSTDVTPITGKVPAWVWPIVSISIAITMQYFRNLSDKREGKP